MLRKRYQPKEDALSSDLPSVWRVDMFFRIGSASPAPVDAPSAKNHTFKSQPIGFVSSYRTLFLALE
jgi:hypothetical protein